MPSAAWGTVKAVCDSLRRQVSDMQEESRPWADQLPRRAARRAPGLPCPQTHLLPPEAEAHSNSAAPSSLLLRTGAAEPRRHHQHHNSDLFSTKFTILLLSKRWAANTCVYWETKPNLVILFTFFSLSRRRGKLLLLFWRRAAGLEGHLTGGARPSSAACSRALPTSPSHVLQPPACSEPLGTVLVTSAPTASAPDLCHQAHPQVAQQDCSLRPHQTKLEHK